MNIPRVLRIAAGAALLAALTGAARAENCTLTQMASLDIVDGPNGTILVPVDVNGTRELFLVDTGGVYSSVTDDVAAQLHLDLHPLSQEIEIYNAAGERFSAGVVVDSLKIGNNEAQHFHMLVRPKRSGETQVGGVLGPDLLKLFDVDFDFTARKLNLFSQDHCEGKVVYWAKAYAALPFKLPDGGHITMTANLDGHDTQTTLDTGASTTFLSSGTALNVFGVSSDSPGIEKIGDPSAPISRYRFKSLSLQDIAVSNPLVILLPDAISEAFRKAHDEKTFNDPVYGEHLDIPPLTLGMNVLRRLHLYIAYKEHVLYATAADAAPPVAASAPPAAPASH
jgi:predicted aspartyl protease